ncbi:MAG: two-component system response regulator [Zetaproteobacteria bacterium]|nr:two-component system response regulator [Pseudobdellovibrionaceae bacterium]
MKILVVEDAESIRVLITIYLNDSGHEIIEARDGKQGLKILNENHDIDVILSDIHMPVMDGIEMLNNIKADNKLNKIPVIMITTETSGAAVDACREGGAKGFVVKPFEQDKLVQLIERVVGG